MVITRATHSARGRGQLCSHRSTRVASVRRASWRFRQRYPKKIPPPKSVTLADIKPTQRSSLVLTPSHRSPRSMWFLGDTFPVGAHFFYVGTDARRLAWL
ncbi:hypothetical protein BHE74_00009631 [Ensete ventricosum]|nr:hypothetical protein BHE74_00009631 [Ensete ventricosum]